MVSLEFGLNFVEMTVSITADEDLNDVQNL